MKIKENTTIVDVAFNLYGSLTGIPAILRQLPVSERIGFDTLPGMGEDVADIGQTWTPDLAGKDVTIKVEKVYNTLGVAKAPYSTDLYRIGAAVRYGEGIIETFLPPDTISFDQEYPMALSGWRKYASCGKNPEVVNGNLRIYAESANSYCGNIYYPNALNIRTDKPIQYAIDVRSARPNVTNNPSNFELTASSNYSYYPCIINKPVKAGDQFEVSIADIKVLVGSPTGFTVFMADEAITKNLSNRGVLTKTNRKITLTVLPDIEEQSNAKVIIYAGIAGETAGNKISFIDVRIADLAAVPPSRMAFGLVDVNSISGSNYLTIVTGVTEEFKHLEFKIAPRGLNVTDFFIGKVYVDSTDGFFEVRNIKVTQYI